MQLHELLTATPDSTVPRHVKLTGEVKFSKLLRIEGVAQGEIVAPGDASLLICKGGSFVGNLVGLGMVYCDGKINGEIQVARLFLGPHAVVRGNVQCQQLSTCGTASIMGKLNVSPTFDVKGRAAVGTHLVDDVPPSEAGVSAPKSANQNADSASRSPQTDDELLKSAPRSTVGDNLTAARPVTSTPATDATRDPEKSPLGKTEAAVKPAVASAKRIEKKAQPVAADTATPPPQASDTKEDGQKSSENPVLCEGDQKSEPVVKPEKKSAEPVPPSAPEQRTGHAPSVESPAKAHPELLTVSPTVAAAPELELVVPEKPASPEPVVTEKPVSPDRALREKKNWLIVVEPQADFFLGGAWFSAAQHGPSEQLCLTTITSFISAQLQFLDHIVVLLDVHYEHDPEQSEYWMDAAFSHPPVGTSIRWADVQSGRWQLAPGADKDQEMHRLSALLEPEESPSDDAKAVAQFSGVSVEKKITILPKHCQVGSSGAAVAPALQKHLSQWVNFHRRDVRYIMAQHAGAGRVDDTVGTKGLRLIAQAGTGPGVPGLDSSSSHYDFSFASQIAEKDQVFICGQMRSHCHTFSMTDLVMQICTQAEHVTATSQHIHVLLDGVAEVFEKDWAGEEAQAREEARDRWTELRGLGASLVQSTEQKLR